MDNSIYIALSRQMAQFEDMAITANNIANADTPGYNAQKLTFAQYLVDNGTTGGKDAYANAPSAYRDTSGGSLKMTNNPLDLAIKGPGYFQVQTPLGARFTKAGNFQIDAQGVVVNVNGYPVLGNDGSQISLPPGARAIDINGLGQIKVDGQTSGQIGVFEFANEQKLKRLGNSLYQANDAPQPAQTARVVQGAIEGSNVNGVTELVHVMDVSRDVANSAKFIETMYDLERKLSTTLSHTKPA